jgi:hypothetical protein
METHQCGRGVGQVDEGISDRHAVEHPQSTVHQENACRERIKCPQTLVSAFQSMNRRKWCGTQPQSQQSTNGREDKMNEKMRPWRGRNCLHLCAHGSRCESGREIRDPKNARRTQNKWLIASDGPPKMPDTPVVVRAVIGNAIVAWLKHYGCQSCRSI